MSDAAPHNEGALSVPVAATIAVGAAGLPAVLAGDIALCDPPIAALRWALATAIAVGVIAGLAARDRWRSGVVPASAFAGFMLGNLALVEPVTDDFVPVRQPRIMHAQMNLGTLVVERAPTAAAPKTLTGAEVVRAAYGRLAWPWLPPIGAFFASLLVCDSQRMLLLVC